MIRFSDVTAHAAPSSVSHLSLELGPGLHAVLGARGDGGPLLLAVAAGWVRARSGRVSVLDGRPSAARNRVAYIPLDARLPPSLRVAEALDAAAAIRGEPAAPARARLGALDVAPLADRWTHTLGAGEARAALLAEAVTSGARVLLLDEPLVDVDPRAAGALPGKLRDLAARGATVVMATSSPRDALDLATTRWLLASGRLLGALSAGDVPSLSAGAEPRLRVVSVDARALLASLAGETDVGRVELDGNALLLTGTDPAAMAQAVARAALASGVELEAMQLDAPRLEELRVAAARRRSISLRPAAIESVRPPPPGAP